MDEVELFIKHRFSKDCDWMNGNCYYFALILCSRFYFLHICYLPVIGHFVAFDLEGTYYDWEGKHYLTDEVIETLNDIELNDPNYYYRLYRDCIK